MPFPKQGDIEVPLLKVLAESGGSAKPRDIYPRVAAIGATWSASTTKRLDALLS